MADSRFPNTMKAMQLKKGMDEGPDYMGNIKSAFQDDSPQPDPQPNQTQYSSNYGAAARQKALGLDPNYVPTSAADRLTQKMQEMKDNEESDRVSAEMFPDEAQDKDLQKQRAARQTALQQMMQNGKSSGQ